MRLQLQKTSEFMLKSIKTLPHNCLEVPKQTTVAGTHAQGFLLGLCSAMATCFETDGASCQSMQPLSAQSPCHTPLLSPLYPGLPYGLLQDPHECGASSPCDKWQSQKPFKA